MAEAPKGGGEVWSAGIGRKSNAQYGSDLMVEVLRELGIKYIALNPGASYRGFHDSMVNFEPEKGPEMIMCTHEEIAVAIANGYARATGEIMATGLHNVVGLQHASMAIFNAWCDRTPILNLGGGGPQDTTQRRSTDWVHTALVQGLAVRDYVKFDDQPSTVDGVAESFLKAYRFAMTEPKGPVYICLDSDVQEAKIDKPMVVPHAQLFRPPAGPGANPESSENCRAFSRRGAMAGNRRRRVGAQSQIFAADARFGRSPGRAGGGLRWSLRFSQHPSVESHQRARRGAAKRRCGVGARCAEPGRAVRAVNARAR